MRTTRMISTLSVVGLWLLACMVAARELPCTFTTSDGQFYDLSPLTDCSLNGYNAPSGMPYSINVCNEVTTYSCTGNAAVCQNIEGSGVKNAGSVNSMTFADLPGDLQGVQVKYGGGDTNGCPNNTPRSSTVNFICDDNAFPEPDVIYVSESPSCNYNFEVRSTHACPRKKQTNQQQWCKVNAYIVAHTHDDVGWQITVDEYYDQEVRQILNQVTQALASNSDRKFSYVEQGFFTKWWHDGNVTDDQRASFMKSYKNGQLEFVIGGWTMNDDACTTFGADIDQLTLGHQFLYNTFGARPTRGWQLDPFGSGSVLPYLEKLAGFESHLIDRVTQKPLYQETQTMQFIWQGVPSQGEHGAIFTEIMDGDLNAYCDFLSVLDFQSTDVTPDNIESIATGFYSLIKERVPHFKTNNILAQWGCDFYFQQGVKAFNNMDKLMDYFKKNENTSGIHVEYATVSDYFNAVKAASDNVQYPTNIGGDFFTYTDGGTWSGYFTSRTQLKGIVRQGEAIGRASEQLFSFGGKGINSQQKSFDSLNELRKANGQATHHDGVTGTSQPPVVQMYEDDINSGIAAQQAINAQILADLMKISPANLNHQLADLLNIKVGQTVAVVLYNSLGWNRKDVVSLPVSLTSFTVVDRNNNTITSQVNRALLSDAVSTHNLFFEVDVDALGYATYFITATNSKQSATPVKVVNGGADSIAENSIYSIEISGVSGTTTTLTNKISKKTIKFAQELRQYVSYPDGGAYVFHPNGVSAPVSGSAPKTVVSVGPVVTEVFQVYPTSGDAYASQVIRLYEGLSPDAHGFVEFAAQVGVLPDTIEMISQFQTNLSHSSVFYTDNNGFAYMKRENTYPTDPIEMQHYPSIYNAYISDDTNDIQMSIISDRAHSAASLAEGEFEVMLHRNPAGQDNKGLSADWVDRDVVYPVNRVVVDTVADSKLATTRQSYLLNFPLIPFSSVDSFTSKAILRDSFIKGPVPDNVHLQSLYALEANSSRNILRFTHLFAVGEHDQLSNDVTIDLTNYFGSDIKSIVETTLTANKVIDETASKTFVLTPKAIRTFVVEFQA